MLLLFLLLLIEIEFILSIYQFLFSNYFLQRIVFLALKTLGIKFQLSIADYAKDISYLMAFAKVDLFFLFNLF